MISREKLRNFYWVKLPFKYAFPIYLFFQIVRAYIGLLVWFKPEWFPSLIIWSFLLDFVDGALLPEEIFGYWYRYLDWGVDTLAYGSLMLYATTIFPLFNYWVYWLIGNIFMLIVAVKYRELVVFKPPIAGLVIPFLSMFELPTLFPNILKLLPLIAFPLTPIFLEYPIHLWQTGKWRWNKTKLQRGLWLLLGATYQFLIARIFFN